MVNCKMDIRRRGKKRLGYLKRQRQDRAGWHPATQTQTRPVSEVSCDVVLRPLSVLSATFSFLVVGLPSRHP
jgi:hypothetical protein